MTKWAQLPAGTAWGGVTTWVAADGKGTVIVLVRKASLARSSSSAAICIRHSHKQMVPFRKSRRRWGSIKGYVSECVLPLCGTPRFASRFKRDRSFLWMGTHTFCPFLCYCCPPCGNKITPRSRIVSSYRPWLQQFPFLFCCS